MFCTFWFGIHILLFSNQAREGSLVAKISWWPLGFFFWTPRPVTVTRPHMSGWRSGHHHSRFYWIEPFVTKVWCSIPLVIARKTMSCPKQRNGTAAETTRTFHEVFDQFASEQWRLPIEKSSDSLLPPARISFWDSTLEQAPLYSPILWGKLSMMYKVIACFGIMQKFWGSLSALRNT